MIRQIILNATDPYTELVSSKRSLTTHSTGAELACLSSRTWMSFDDSSRPVNSGVMSPLRINTKKSPAAPQLNDVELGWIMREAGRMAG